MNFKERLFLALAPYAPIWWYLGSLAGIIAFCSAWWFWAYAPLRSEYRSRAMIVREAPIEQSLNMLATSQPTAAEKSYEVENSLAQLADYIMQTEHQSACRLEAIDLNESQKTCTCTFIGSLSTILARLAPAPHGTSIAIKTLSCTRYDDATVRMQIQYTLKQPQQAPALPT